MNKQNTVIVSLAVLAAVSAAFWLLLAAPALTGNEINMPVGVTPQSQTHYELHMLILWICVVDHANPEDQHVQLIMSLALGCHANRHVDFIASQCRGSQQQPKRCRYCCQNGQRNNDGVLLVHPGNSASDI